MKLSTTKWGQKLWKLKTPKINILSSAAANSASLMCVLCSLCVGVKNLNLKMDGGVKQVHKLFEMGSIDGQNCSWGISFLISPLQYVWCL